MQMLRRALSRTTVHHSIRNIATKRPPIETVAGRVRELVLDGPYTKTGRRTGDRNEQYWLEVYTVETADGVQETLTRYIDSPDKPPLSKRGAKTSFRVRRSASMVTIVGGDPKGPVRTLQGTLQSVNRHRVPGKEFLVDKYVVITKEGQQECTGFVPNEKAPHLANPGDKVSWRVQKVGTTNRILSKSDFNTMTAKVISIEREGPHEVEEGKRWFDWYVVKTGEKEQQLIFRTVLDDRWGCLCDVGEEVTFRVKNLPESFCETYGIQNDSIDTVTGKVVSRIRPDQRREIYSVEVRPGVTRECILWTGPEATPIAEEGQKVTFTLKGDTILTNKKEKDIEDSTVKQPFPSRAPCTSRRERALKSLTEFRGRVESVERTGPHFLDARPHWVEKYVFEGEENVKCFRFLNSPKGETLAAAGEELHVKVSWMGAFLAVEEEVTYEVLSGRVTAVEREGPFDAECGTRWWRDWFTVVVEEEERRVFVCVVDDSATRPCDAGDLVQLRVRSWKGCPPELLRLCMRVPDSPPLTATAAVA
eukprot:Hpha_TRINITY_DN15811_c2_g11::TRINITY_DN15811_c2_g11_i1::g.187572::m.187572